MKDNSELIIRNDEFDSMYKMIISLLVDNKEISEQLADFSKRHIKKYENDLYLKSNFVLALISVWYDYIGTLHLPKELIDKIIIEDLNSLKELGADEIFINKRKKILLKFFAEIEEENHKVRKIKHCKLDFKKGNCIYSEFNNKYIIGVVLEENFSKKEILIALFYEERLINIKELYYKKPIIVGWCDANISKIFKKTDSILLHSFNNIKIYDNIIITRTNIDCSKGIYINYLYFTSPLIEYVGKYSLYDGYDLRLNDKNEVIVLKEHSSWGWEHIRKADFELLKDYIS